MNIIDQLHRSPIGRTWQLIKSVLDPIARPIAEPIQRWDDRRTARHLREHADLIAAYFPEEAAKMRARAEELTS